MKKRLCFVALLPVFAGCLSPAPPAPTHWLIEWTAASGISEPTAGRPSVKLVSVSVRAPWNGSKLAVLRPDGSVAFDSYNGFAAHPAALLKGPAEDVLAASGVFGRVVSPGSSASSRILLELTVTRLALDCREEGRRNAVVDLSLTAVGDRRVLASAGGERSVPVEGRDYSAAFSKAFADALVTAARALPPLEK